MDRTRLPDRALEIKVKENSTVVKPDTRKHQDKEENDKKWKRKYCGKKEETADLLSVNHTKGTKMPAAAVIVVVVLVLEVVHVYMAGIYSNKYKETFLMATFRCKYHSHMSPKQQRIFK